MESFKVYLPSNACPDLFPNNTATDYRTRFDKEIALNGQWEVGMESIIYSSHIKDDKEKAQIYFLVKMKQPKPVNELFPFEFITNSKRKWKGFEGVIPNVFETNTAQVDSILDTLNAMNRNILMSQKLTVYGRVLSFP